MDVSTNTKCEIRLEVQMPRSTLRIDVVQHGSEVPLHSVLPKSTTKQLLSRFDNDLEEVSKAVRIAANRIEIIDDPSLHLKR